MRTMRSVLVAAACLGCLTTVVGPMRSTAADGSVSVAAPKQRQYRCTKCREIHTFDRPGNYKCPKCGKPLIPVT